MADGFCASVGVDTTTGAVNCSDIDFDALLLGGCWCHVCLPENPCQNGGTCANHQNRGYTCSCPSGFAGDHCQLPAGADLVSDISSSFPYHINPRPRQSSPSPLAPPLPSAPPTPNASDFLLPAGDAAQTAAEQQALMTAVLAGGIGGAAGLLILVAAAWSLHRHMRRSRVKGLGSGRQANADYDDCATANAPSRSPESA